METVGLEKIKETLSKSPIKYKGEINDISNIKHEDA